MISSKTVLLNMSSMFMLLFGILQIQQYWYQSTITQIYFGTLLKITHYVVIKLNIASIKVGGVGIIILYTILMLLIGKHSYTYLYDLLDRW